MMKLCRSMAAATLVTTATGGAALAQMYLPDARIQADDTTNVYFGSTKDVDGHFLSGVAAEVRGGNATYVMVTDDAGRFKIRVPKALPASALKVGCSKPGYVLVRVVKRPPPKGATSPMQADCILAPGRTAAK